MVLRKRDLSCLERRALLTGGSLRNPPTNPRRKAWLPLDRIVEKLVLERAAVEGREDDPVER